jgi:hypothetical protein
VDLWGVLLPIAVIFSIVIWSPQSPRFAHET